MQLEFGDSERAAAAVLIEQALSEDLGDAGDLTCRALIDPDACAQIDVVARREGVLAGGPVAKMVFVALDAKVAWNPTISDGSSLQAGDVLATVSGSLRSLLTGERTALNFLTHLSGVATLARRFVDAVTQTKARIFDTRKTLPGYRMLEKYAVRAGGATNHRMGLYDGVLIKDNHLAAWSAGGQGASIAEAIRHVRGELGSTVPIEVEVDTIEQLADALAAKPEIVLLDNMPPAVLTEAVKLRDSSAPAVEFEASGGVTLETVGEIARTGVERISVGAITHSAPVLDLAFDWRSIL